MRSTIVFPLLGRRFVVVAFAAVLAACGGGGGGGSAVDAPSGPAVISAGLMTATESVGGGFCVGTTLFQWYTPTGRQTPAQYNSPRCGGASAQVETLSGQICNGTKLINLFAPYGRQEVSDEASPVCGVVPVNAQGPGRFESAARINIVEKADIAAATKAEGLLGIEPRYAVSNYRLTYVTVDGYGNPVRASAFWFPGSPAFRDSSSLRTRISRLAFISKAF